MGKGWIKLHRSLLDSPIWRCLTPEQKIVAMTCLLLANHEEKKWMYGGKPYVCQAGQFITSLEKLTEKCGEGATVKKTRTALTKLEELGFLANTSTKKGRLITIENWGLYQGLLDDEGKQMGNQRADRGQTEGKARATNKNIKNYKNDKKNKYELINTGHIKVLVHACFLKGIDPDELCKRYGHEFLGEMSTDEFEEVMQEFRSMSINE